MAQVFISYSRVNEDRAWQLYYWLREKGFDVWFDRVSLVPGQVFEEEIERAIPNSDFIIILLSKHSVDRQCFFRHEIDMVLKALDTPSCSRPAVIPVRLDDRPIDTYPLPEKLKKIHWQDLLPDWDSMMSGILEVVREQLVKDGELAHRDVFQRNAEDSSSNELFRAIFESCRLQVRAAQRNLIDQRKFVPDTYIRRKLDYVFDRFLADQDSSCIVVVDDPGTGKTSLLAYEASQCLCEDRKIPTLLLATDEYLDIGQYCSSFEDFILKVLKSSTQKRFGDLRPTSSLEQLLGALPHREGKPKLLVVLDGLNEIHSADHALTGQRRETAVSSQSLLQFIKKQRASEVKLLVSSRRRTWASLYERDTKDWSKVAWEPEWKEMFSGAFLGGIRPWEFVGSHSEATSADTEQKVRRVIAVELGKLDDLETSLALGLYQTRRKVRIVPGDEAFSELKDPFLLGLCFTVWAKAQQENPEFWYYVEPDHQSGQKREGRIELYDSLDWYDLSKQYWSGAVERVARAMHPEEDAETEQKRAHIRTLISWIVKRIMDNLWKTGSDRIPEYSLCSSTESRRVLKQMQIEEMVVLEQSEQEDVFVKFPRDRITSFHIVQALERRLACRPSEDVILEFVEMAEKYDIFTGLTRPVLRMLRSSRMFGSLSEKLMDILIWRATNQPEWFIDVIKSLDNLDQEVRERTEHALRLRLFTWLLPAKELKRRGFAEPLTQPKAELVIQKLGSSKINARDSIDVLRSFGKDVKIHLSETVIDLLHELPELYRLSPKLAEDIEQAALHAVRRQRTHADEPSAVNAVKRTRRIFRPDLEHELHNIGNDLYKGLHFESAVRFYREALRIRPDLLETHFNLALAYAKLSKYPEGRKCLDTVIRLNPNLAEAYYTRGLLHEYEGSLDLAITDYDKALEIDPNYDKAAQQRNAARVKMSVGELDETSTASDSGRLYFELACDCAGQGDDPKAREYLEKARKQGFKPTIDDMARIPRAKWNSGLISRAIENYVSLLWGLTAFERSDLASILLSIGAAHCDIGKPTLDLEYHLAATAADPKLSTAFSNIASSFAGPSSPYLAPEAAIREAETSIALSHDLSVPQFVKARAHEMLGKEEQAIACYEEAAARGDFCSAEALFVLADRYAGRFTEEKRHNLLHQASALFKTKEKDAVDRYVLSALAQWWYCGAKTMVMLMDPHYIDFANKACKLVLKSTDIRPYSYESQKPCSRDEFIADCRELDKLFVP